MPWMCCLSICFSSRSRWERGRSRTDSLRSSVACRAAELGVGAELLDVGAPGEAVGVRVGLVGHEQTGEAGLVTVHGHVRALLRKTPHRSTGVPIGPLNGHDGVRNAPDHTEEQRPTGDTGEYAPSPHPPPGRCYGHAVGPALGRDSGLGRGLGARLGRGLGARLGRGLGPGHKARRGRGFRPSLGRGLRRGLGAGLRRGRGIRCARGLGRRGGVRSGGVAVHRRSICRSARSMIVFLGTGFVS